jgi:hypothetical protein
LLLKTITEEMFDVPFIFILHSLCSVMFSFYN